MRTAREVKRRQPTPPHERTGFFDIDRAQRKGSPVRWATGPAGPFGPTVQLAQTGLFPPATPLRFS